MINEFVDEDGRPIPIIFRLWHEMEDSWAWWCPGSDNVSKADYITFYQLTVNKIRSKCPDAQILFGYGPDRYLTNYGETSYLTYYPGDSYVDILGYDDYWIARTDKTSSALSIALENARTVSKVAAKKGKPAVLFETNNDLDATVDVFFSDYVQPMLKDSEVSLSVFQIWSAFAGTSAKAAAFEEFKKQDNIIFDH